MQIEGVDISNPDKLLFPDKGITKADMVEYYHRVADRMLPFMKDRPLTLQRFPDGIGEQGFYQKKAADYFPDFIDRVKIETKDDTQEQVICNSKKSLVYLANQGTITFHVWLSRKDKLHRPDRVVYDLDPPEDSFELVKEATKKVGDFLRETDLEPELMTTGKSGFHLYFTRRRTKDFDDVRAEAKELAEEMSARYPDLLTTETRKDKRKGRVFVDYLRNAYAQTAVCPYSLRPIPSAGIATPIGWDELSKIDSPDKYHIGNIFRRLSQKS